jgi:hypothetical protein
MRRLMQGRQVLVQNLQTSQLSLHGGMAGFPRIAGHQSNYAHIKYRARIKHVAVLVRLICRMLVRLSLHHRADAPVSYGVIPDDSLHD